MKRPLFNSLKFDDTAEGAEFEAAETVFGRVKNRKCLASLIGIGFVCRSIIHVDSIESVHIGSRRIRFRIVFLSSPINVILWATSAVRHIRQFVDPTKLCQLKRYTHYIAPTPFMLGLGLWRLMTGQ